MRRCLVALSVQGDCKLRSGTFPHCPLLRVYSIFFPAQGSASALVASVALADIDDVSPHLVGP